MVLKDETKHAATLDILIAGSTCDVLQPAASIPKWQATKSTTP
ncbi:hypothetical Protein YC6258_00695 [Gynuella sunshinyii YC6258]|uniref:Uncharacterized protein n=1 Tax=Gynuella sunshinyii YC6258 TaxID=1445510 RepID=A0A0C5UZP4_9GAMM|nr:hypothetical Protein YC6258_00695 [Gynuella sunshinyii YC6258]